MKMTVQNMTNQFLAIKFYQVDQKSIYVEENKDKPLWFDKRKKTPKSRINDKIIDIRIQKMDYSTQMLLEEIREYGYQKGQR